jgi:hypothetical protein
VKNRKEMVKAIAMIDTIKRGDCRKYVEDKFSPQAAAKKHIEIYQKEIVKNRYKPAEEFARRL